jgi:hypothetical protein
LVVDAIVTEMLGGIDTINQNPGTVVSKIAIDARSLEQARNGVSVARGNCVLQYMPGHGTVHRAGIYVIETDLFRELARDAAFAGRGRAIDRNDAVNGRDIHGENMCRCLRKIAGNPSAFATQAVCLHAFILRLSWRV